MQFRKPENLFQLLQWMASGFCLTVTIGIIRQYHFYFPPDFGAGFLLDRHLYFWQWYWLAFYIHIIVTPLTLVNGLFLTHDRSRSMYQGAHKILGRVQVFIILLFVVPSGLMMSLHASGGFVAGAGFASQALALFIFTSLGWNYAVRKQFDFHRRWMLRGLLTLCGAIVLRLLAATTDQAGWSQETCYPIAAWVCWLLPLGSYEIIRLIRSRPILSPR